MFCQPKRGAPQADPGCDPPPAAAAVKRARGAAPLTWNPNALRDPPSGAALEARGSGPAGETRVWPAQVRREGLAPAQN